jgi:uncharacterized repeat protein (TIGR02543 family)
LALYRKTTPSTYSNVPASNFTDSGKNWRKHSNMYRKTSGNETASLTAVPGRYTDSTRTWRRIKAMYRWTGSYWQRIFYKNSNQPFATTAPTIRYNSYNGLIVDSYETDSENWWATDPYQPQWAQVGPGPNGIGQDTWYINESGTEVGASTPTFLWGKDGVWVNDTGASTSASFVYNDILYKDAAPSVVDDEGNYSGDKFRHSESVLGTYDEMYIWYRISKSVGSYIGQGFSQAVFITKQEPTINYFTMTSPGIATVGTAKTVNYSFSNKWWKQLDQNISNIEWHELSYSTQTPDSSTLKATHYLWETTISTETATTLAGTDSYIPTGSNKYIYARINYKNSWTEFPPITSKSEEVQTTVATQQACGPFTLSNATKGIRYYDAVSSSWKRTVTVDIGQSASADRYELQIRGYGPWNGSTDYYFPTYYYTTLLTYDDSPYTMESGRSGGVLTATANVADYQYYEITARAKFGGTTDGSIISTNTLYPPGVAPSSPSISSIATTADYFGTYISFNIYQSSFGSNAEKYYEYSLNGGSFSQISTGTYGTLGTGYINQVNGAKIYVAEGTYYTVQIRAVNYDGETSSSSNSLNITSSARPGAPTNVVVKSFAANTGHVFFTSGNNTASMNAWLEYDSFMFTDSIQGYININSNTAGVIALSGANSTTRSYTSYLRPYLSSNKTGAEGSLTAYSSKVLNGNDNPTATIGNPYLGTNGSYDIGVSIVGGGSANKHEVALVQYLSPYNTIATKTVSGINGTASFTSADGTQPNTTYYVRVTSIYEYSTGVSYSGTPSVSSNIKTNAIAATYPTSVTAANNGSTDTVTISWSGATNATVYRIYWNSNGVSPGSPATYYDEEKFVNFSTITETSGSWAWGPSDPDRNSYTPSGRGAQYYFVSASADGTTWTPYASARTSSAVGVYLPTPTIITNPTLSGTPTVGQTLTLGVGTWNYSPVSYSLRLYRGTPGVTTSETFVQDFGNVTSATYTIPPSEYTDSQSSGRKRYRVFASATNGTGTSGLVGGTETTTDLANNVLTTPAIVGTPSQSSPGGTLTVNVSGGGPAYQIYWWSSATAPGVGVTPDGSSTTTTIEDPTGPSSLGTWYVYARSALTTGTTGTTAPSTSLSNWSSGSSYTLSATRFLSYDANTGTGAPSQTSGIDSGSGWSTTVSGTVPTKSGSTFAGWNTNSSGTGTNYASNAAITLTANVTLWAKWTSNSVIPTITMSGNTGVTAAQGTINWTSTNQSSYSSTGTFSGTGTTGTSISKTGLSASTTYTGTVTVTSSTGNTASANYSLTTSPAATPATFTIGTVSASRTATRQITGTWSSTRSGGSFQWWNTRIRNTSSGATATHSLYSETPKSDIYTSLTGTSYRFGVQGVSYDSNYSVYRYTVGSSDMSAYTENSSNINPA